MSLDGSLFFVTEGYSSIISYVLYSYVTLGLDESVFGAESIRNPKATFYSFEGNKTVVVIIDKI
jgi:hypothetical protein